MIGLIAIRRVAPRRVVLITGVVAAVIMGDSMIYNVIPSNVSTFGVSLGLVGVLLSANRVVRLASNLLAPWVVQRFGISKPVLVSAVLSIGTTAIFGVAHGFAALLAARIVWGACYSLMRLGGYLVVLEESSDRTRGRSMGFFGGGQRMGSFVGVLLGGILFDAFGRTTSFLAIAGLGFLGLPASLALIRNPDSRVATEIQTRELESYTLKDAHKCGRIRLWDLMISPVPELKGHQRQQLLAVNFAFFSFHLVMSGTLVATLGFYLSQRLEEDITIAGIVLGVATINGFLLATRWMFDVASPYLGYLGDRVGQQKIPLFALPICAGALFLMAFKASLWLTLSWLPFAFVASAASYTSLSVLAGGLSPAYRRAQVMSRHATWQDVGSASGPLLSYAVLVYLSLELVYLVGALFMLLALGFVATSFRPHTFWKPVE